MERIATRSKTNELDALYDFEPMPFRPKLTWPEDRWLAVVMILNLEVFDIRAQFGGGPAIFPLPGEAGQPNLGNYAWREYGLRVGVWRLFDIFDRAGIKISCQTNADIAWRYPAVAQTVRSHGWEVAAHSVEQVRPPLLWQDDPEGERRLIRETVESIEAGFGVRPTGWLSPGQWSTLNTPRLLAEEGFTWFADYVNDDQPYLMRAGGKTIVSVPYETEMNDFTMMLSTRSADAYFEVFKEQFDVLYEEGSMSGRMMTVSVHPQVSGRPHWAAAVRRMVDYVRRHHQAWFATRGEIAEWFLAQRGKS